MRVVCSFVGGAGHLHPQIPLHRALAAAGHELTLRGRASATQTAPREIYRTIAGRPDQRSQLADEIAPLAPVDIEHELAVIARHFAGDAARTSAAAISADLANTDLVVCDEVDFGAIGAAQQAGIPVAVVAVAVSGAIVRPRLLHDALTALGHDLGMSGPVRPYGDAFVVPFDPSMRDPAHPAPSNALWMRPDSGAAPQPDGSIVATLGTEFNTESGDLFDRILSALALLDAPATLAVGRDLDPSRFGDQPAHIKIRQYVDLAALVPRASVVLHHGGSGLFLQSVLGGAPQVVFPMGADQPFTADRVHDLGLGRVLDPMTATPDEIARVISAVRADGNMRSRVLALRSSTLALPEPAAVVEHLSRIAR